MSDQNSTKLRRFPFTTIHYENKNKNIRSIPSIEIFLLFEEWNVAC